MHTPEQLTNLPTAEAQVFLTSDEIATHVGDIATRLPLDNSIETLVVGVLPEGLLFMADLVKAMCMRRMALTTGFVITGKPNQLAFNTASLPDIRRKHVIFAHARVLDAGTVLDLADRVSSQAQQVTQVALVSHAQGLAPEQLDAAVCRPAPPLYGYGIARQPDGAHAHLPSLYTYPPPAASLS